MTDEELDQRIHHAQERAGAANERAPVAGSWGLASYGDGPPALGGGVGGFLWFVSRDDLLAFVGESLTFFSPGPSSVAPAAVAEKVEALVREHRAGERSAEDTRAALNKALRRFSHVQWWGPFDELLAGDVPFVCEVRAWFREAEGEEGSTLAPDRPIAPEEVDEFLGALVDWGL